ncbi:MAG: class A beta-lactamase [Alphaproteobacteria bacterium]|nr:class A beta-lactamase [Alphaproteobacteria bacterium]
MRSLSRRTVVISAAAAGACAGAPAGDAPWDARIAQIERSVGGRLGVSAASLDDATAIHFRGDERFAMCSTFKAALAACILAHVESGALALDQPLPFSEADLLDYAPVARARLREGALGVEEACAAAVQVSDNTAANLLLAQIGGPEGFTAYMRSLGDTATRLDRNEPTLNTNLPDDPRDTTTPRAMRATLARLVYGDAGFPASSRALLKNWMQSSTTGLQRVRAGLPQGWMAGDKTGTSGNGAVNDIVFFEPPNRPAVVAAVYLNAPGASAEAAAAAHAMVGRLLAEAFG